MGKEATFSGGFPANQHLESGLANPRIVDRNAEQRDHCNDHPQVHVRMISEMAKGL
jgi:hypothetical protein